jgi:hypothetical protein
MRSETESRLLHTRLLPLARPRFLAQGRHWSVPTSNKSLGGGKAQPAAERRIVL